MYFNKALFLFFFLFLFSIIQKRVCWYYLVKNAEY